MEIARLVVEALSSSALLLTLLYLASEAKLARQLAATGALNDSVNGVDKVVSHFLTFPELRKYFYEGADPGEAGNDDRARVAILAELFADALENGLDAVKTLEPASRMTTDWVDCAIFMLLNSPALVSRVHENPRWWPCLAEVLDRLGLPPADGSTSLSSPVTGSPDRAIRASRRNTGNIVVLSVLRRRRV
jgi:hypothetical protein